MFPVCPQYYIEIIIKVIMKNLSRFTYLFLIAIHLTFINHPVPAQSKIPGLILYNAPHRHYLNNDYTIQVRKEGGEWQNLAGYYAINMNKGPYAGPTLNIQTFAYFDSDFKQRIELRVTRNRGVVHDARIRPSSYGIEFTRKDSSISFFLNRPLKISVEFDQDIYTNLFIFANGIESDPPNNGDPGVKYFGPGFHEAGTIDLNSDETIYLAGGSVVRGAIRGKGISNATVRGRGILLNGGIRIDDSNNITIDGIIIIDSPGWTIVPRQVSNSVIRDIKMINKTISSDGINPVGCNNLTIEDVFLRIPDDCISIKALRVERPNLDIMIRKSVFWSDAAHCILIGPEGNATSTERVTFSDCDFLECQYTESDYWGVFAITNGDDMTIKDITFENCRVEDFSHSNLVAIRIESNIWTKSSGGPVMNIVFRNISYNGKNTNASYIKGYNDTRNVNGIIFDNLQINGKKILSPEQGNFQIGPNSANVVFK